MSLQTPTVQQISENIVSQIEAEISKTVPLLPKGFTRVLAKALAGVFIIIYKYAGFSLLQYFVSTAANADTVINGKTVNPLVEWGRLIGVGDPTAATRAELTATITVLNQVGSLPAGSQLLRAETGVLYLTLTSVLLDAATKSITVRASSDQSGGGGAGTIGNLNAGETISFANAQPNVATDAVITAQTVTGADAEDSEVYRQRIIDRFQQQPQGGAYADYKVWGEGVEGILSIFPYTSASPGEVDVYAEATEASSGSADGIPTTAQLAAVANAIELDDNGLASRRPANAFVNVFPITRTAFDVTITSLTAPDIAAAQATITSALDDYFRSREPFIVGLSRLPRADRITQASVGGVADEAANSVGATIVTVEVDLGGGNAVNLGQGELAKAGIVTFV